MILSNQIICLIFIVVFQLESLNAIHFPWMYYLPYGETVTLKPLFRNSSEEIEIKSCKWTTPKNLDIIPGTYNYDLDRFRLDKIKCELTIYDIQKDTNGIYHCTINDIHISKAMLNVHGAPKKSDLEQYTPNLIAGFSTAGSIIALFAFSCALYHFRYKEINHSNLNYIYIFIKYY